MQFHENVSLERYCRGRLIVLNPRSSAHDAARAMSNNHVGAVVVVERGEPVGIVTDRDLALAIVAENLDADRTPLREVMSPGPLTVPIDASEEEALHQMKQLKVRRLVVVDGQHLAGIVTLDDLIVSGAASLGAVQEIVIGQLSEAAPAKPAGMLRPEHLGGGSGRAERRHRAHQQTTLARFARQLRDALGVDDPELALEAFDVVARHLVRRLTAAEANAFTSQLPAIIREQLLDVRAGPDRQISFPVIVDAMSWQLGLGPADAAELVRRVGRALGEFVSEGELRGVRSQLPNDLKELLPAA